MRLRAALVAALAAAALVGCGGDDASTVGADSAAPVAPESAVLYASISTDADSDQWKQADELLQRFPGRDELLAALRDALADEGGDWETDVEPALGPTVELVALGVDDVDEDLVGLTKPKDEAKFRELLERGEDAVVMREIDGWTAFASSEATLDRFEQARGEGRLTDRDEFDELMGELPEEALAKVWFDARGVNEAAAKQLGGMTQLGQLQPRAGAVALEAVDDGVRMVVHFRNDSDLEAPEFGELAEQVPADAYAFVNAHGFDGRLKVTEQLRGLPGLGMAAGGLERQIGVTLEEVSTLFNQEILLWVRPGAIIPEVTLVLEVDDEDGARDAVDKIVAAAAALGQAERTQRQVGDVDATQVDLGQFALLYAAFDGKLVVTTQPSGIEALTEDVDRLVDADAYEQTLEAADVPDGEQVVMWVDLQRALELVETLAALGQEPIPPDVRENVEPLQAVVLSAEPSLSDGSMQLFLHVR